MAKSNKQSRTAGTADQDKAAGTEEQTAGAAEASEAEDQENQSPQIAEGGENGEKTGEKPPAAEEKSAKNANVAEKDGAKWSFPSVSRCPRCGATDTKALSTQRDRQYRECTRAVCRRRFTVLGKKV